MEYCRSDNKRQLRYRDITQVIGHRRKPVFSVQSRCGVIECRLNMISGIAEYRETTSTTMNDSEDPYIYMEPRQYYNLVQLFAPYTSSPIGQKAPASSPLYEPLRTPDTMETQTQYSTVALESDSVAPPLPRRTPGMKTFKIQPEEHPYGTPKTRQETHHYENNLPRGHVVPMVQDENKKIVPIDANKIITPGPEQGQHDTSLSKTESISKNEDEGLSGITPLVSVNETRPRVPMKPGLVRELQTKLKQTGIHTSSPIQKTTDSAKEKTVFERPLPSVPYESPSIKDTLPSGQNRPPLITSTLSSTSDKSSPTADAVPHGQDKPLLNTRTLPSTPVKSPSIFTNTVQFGQDTPHLNTRTLASSPAKSPPITITISSKDAKVSPNISSTPFTQDKRFSTSKTHDEKPLSARTLPSVNSPEDISDLCLDDVSEYLKVLGLGNYVDAFKEQLVDGELLRELNKDILMQDFGMRVIEAIRLVKFITTGHIPK